MDLVMGVEDSDAKKLRDAIEEDTGLSKAQKQEYTLKYLMIKVDSIDQAIRHLTDSLATLQQFTARLDEVVKNRETIREHTQQLSSLDERVKILEDNSLILLIKAHPKIASSIALFLFAFFNLWFISDFRRPILEWMGFPGAP